MRTYQKKILFIAGYSLFIILLLEIWARGYYAARRGLGFFSSPSDQIYMWYPELRQMEEYEYDEERLNVLLLGGSVMTADWGEVPRYLSKETESVFGKEANIVNLAAAAHGSRDSLNKYNWALDKKFDVVALYHGINEIRANNIPPDLWKEDYSHYSWYNEVNFFFRYPWLRKMGLVLPYFVKHLLMQLEREVIHRDKYVPEHSPRQEWLDYGGDIKTAGSFRKNLVDIIDIAGSKGENLLIMTFACYSSTAPSYAEDPLLGSVGLWGKAENVYSGMKAHNEVIEDLASSGKVEFLDQKELIGGDKRYFTDVCHFSEEGSRVFAENAVKKMKDIMPEKDQGK